ncbi:MAG: hypothetical protein ACM3O4_00870 [Ignavibacteriales bacterium]
MNKKNLIFITIISILLIIIGIIITIEYFNRKQNTNNYKITLFGKTLNSLEELQEEDIKVYLKWTAVLLTAKTYNQFSDEDITFIVMYEKLNRGASASNNEIQKFVENFFGKKNFQLKEGKYTSSIKDEATISKNGDIFTSTLVSLGVPGPVNHYKSMEIKNNQVIVHYNYEECLYMGPPIEGKDQFKLLGTTDIYLKYSDNNLILEKIIYTKK